MGKAEFFTPKFLTLDFETYYTSTDLGFRTQTTEEYLRDPRFHVIGVAVKEGRKRSVWMSGSHAEIREFLLQYDWENSIAIAHNAVFDMAILNWIFDIRPGRIADTLSMARGALGPFRSNSLASLAAHFGVGAKGDEVVNAIDKRREDFRPDELARYGEYCKNDVELTFDIFCRLAIDIPIPEMRLIDMTIRMFTEPVLVGDTELLENHLEEVRAKKSQLLQSAAFDQAELMSNLKFADALTTLGVEPPMKVSRKTGKLTFAFAKTDSAMTDLLEHPNPGVQSLVAARLGVKSTLEETRTERFLAISRRGRIPIPLGYHLAHTSRWAGFDKINMQNLPSRGANHKLKESLMAPEGYVLVNSDSSQIEARVLAWLARQWDLVEDFRNERDIYSLMAGTIYGIPLEQVQPSQRDLGKATILGCGYGMGAERFMEELRKKGISVSLTEAMEIIIKYRRKYPNIEQLWHEANVVLEIMARKRSETIAGLIPVVEDGLLMPNGLIQWYPGITGVVDPNTHKGRIVYKGRNGALVNIYGAKTVENICQSLARSIIGHQMIQIGKRYKVVLTVHDSITALVPESEVEEGVEFIKQEMRKGPDWAHAIPLNCKATYGKRYS